MGGGLVNGICHCRTIVVFCGYTLIHTTDKYLYAVNVIATLSTINNVITRCDKYVGGKWIILMLSLLHFRLPSLSSHFQSLIPVNLFGPLSLPD